MNIQNQYGEPKPGFGEASDPKNRKEINDAEKAREEEEKKKERQEIIEDTSSINYGNIGVEGGVEDLDEEP